MRLGTPTWRLLRAAALLIATLACAPGASAAGLLYRLPYQWFDENARPLMLAKFGGKPTVITMSYGACQKICSTTLRRLEELQKLADREGLDINFVVVSLDPKSDTPEAWRDYRKWRGLARPNWSFLSGSADHTSVLASYLGIGFWVYHDHVVHDFGITLLDAEGNIVRNLKWADTTLDGFLAPRTAAR
jgi:protein SCO1/2